MKNYIPGILLLNSLPVFSAASAEKPVSKPNILWLVSEDNSPYFGIYGDKVARTPHVDQLAKTGVIFDQALVVHVPDKFKHLMPEKTGTHSDRLVSFVDLAPTILNLAGIKIPDYMQGQAFLGENVSKSKAYVFGFRGRMDERHDLMHTARNSRYRYIRNYYPERIYGQYLSYLWKSRALRDWEKQYKSGNLNAVQSAYWQSKPYEELYDVVNDPHNINNLANDHRYGNELAKLRKATDNWIEETKPLDVFPEPLMWEIDKKSSLWDSLKSTNYPLMKIHKVAQMSARGSKEDFKKLVAYANDKNPVIAFWGIKSMFRYENELKSAGLLNEIKKNLSHPELYIQNLTANLLLSLGEDIDCKEIILRGLNSENDFNRLEAVMLYQRLKRNKDIDTFIKIKYANQFDNGDNYEQRVLKEIYGGTFN